jgi:hypothetical protein
VGRKMVKYKNKLLAGLEHREQMSCIHMWYTCTHTHTPLTWWLCWWPTAMASTVWACRCVFTCGGNIRHRFFNVLNIHLTYTALQREPLQYITL